MKIIITMLHEEAELNSATRLFRGRAVLQHTLTRLLAAEFDAEMIVVVFEDQADAASPICSRLRATLHAQPRRPIASLDAMTNALRFSDGWRNALHRTCCFDRGFHAATLEPLLQGEECLLIDAASGLLDVRLLRAIVDTAASQPGEPIIFTPAAPGLAGVLLRNALIAELAASDSHPGSRFHYDPQRPARDPLSSPSCAPTPPALARTTQDFLLDSDRQIRIFTTAPTTSSSLELLNHSRIRRERRGGVLLRELTLELTARRRSSPLFSPLCTSSAVARRSLERLDLDPELARRAIAQLALADDARLTLAGVGDPLLHPHCLELIGFARSQGVHAIHLETDLIEMRDASMLLQSGVHAISIHLPAVLASTYRELMQIDAMPRVLDNIRQLVIARAKLGAAGPLLVPTFTKCQHNLGEMEQWYDQWLQALRSATIRGPRDYGDLIENPSVADMGALGRVKACDLCVLSDGTIVASEDDVLGTAPMGNIAETCLKHIHLLEVA